MEDSCTAQNTTDSRADSEESVSAVDRLRQFRCFGVATVEAIAFWTAVLLPVPIVLSLARGVGTRAEFAAVLALLAANIGAFHLGHGYGHSRI